MQKENKTIRAYGIKRAKKYDNESRIARGNREQHKAYLFDLLSFIKSKQKVQKSFVELGCGTGYFTELFYEIFPEIIGTVIDGSENMLKTAKERFKSSKANISYQCSLFQEFNWNSLSLKPNIVFSSFAIHHMEDKQKWKLFRTIHKNLADDGIFILFDSFRPKDKRSDKLLEYFACMDIKRRVKSERGLEVPIEKVIEKDREAKEAEGDQEASLEDCIGKLKNIGFTSITVVFQEVRFAGIIAYRKNERQTHFR